MPGCPTGTQHHTDPHTHNTHTTSRLTQTPPHRPARTHTQHNAQAHTDTPEIPPQSQDARMSHGNPPSHRLAQTPLHRPAHTHITQRPSSHTCRDTPALRRVSGQALGRRGEAPPSPPEAREPTPPPAWGPLPAPGKALPPPHRPAPAAGWLRFPRKRCHCCCLRGLQGLQRVPDKLPEPAWNSGCRWAQAAGRGEAHGQKEPGGPGQALRSSGEASPARQRPTPRTPRPAQAKLPTLSHSRRPSRGACSPGDTALLGASGR